MTRWVSKKAGRPKLKPWEHDVKEKPRKPHFIPKRPRVRKELSDELEAMLPLDVLIWEHTNQVDLHATFRLNSLAGSGKKFRTLTDKVNGVLKSIILRVR